MESGKVQVLIEQYKIAVSLYKHEDDLNWKKLNNLFYVNTGLWAVSGFILRSGSAGEEILKHRDLLITTMCVVGLVICAAFEIALTCGVKYLRLRKQSVCDFEETLRGDYDGEYIVGPLVDGIRRKSWTTYLLRWAPILPAAIWVTIIIMTR